MNHDINKDTPMDVSNEISVTERQRWMSILAKAPTEQLMALSESGTNSYEFEVIRKPEVGLTQVRARMGAKGDQFNLGDMTITRCVVRSPEGSLGYSYIAGRKKDHALRAAKVDALLQEESLTTLILNDVIKPLEKIILQDRIKKQQQSANTKVDFFTLVRGED